MLTPCMFTLPKKVTVALVSCSLLLVGTSVVAEKNDKSMLIEPTPEMITTYIRPAKALHGENNETTPSRVSLGKHLFFDPRLSGSNFISCSTCHNPALGWSDGFRPFCTSWHCIGIFAGACLMS